MAALPETPKINPIRRQLRNLLFKGQVVEVRVPKGGKDGTISGFFDNSADLANAAEQLSGKYAGVYFTLNPINPELIERSRNRLTFNCDRNTLSTDADIIRRNWLLIDTDPVRPADVSSNDAEHDAAMNLAAEVRSRLTALGWPEPIVADSGNGAHLLYRIDLPNDEPTRVLIRGVLNRLAKDHDNDVIKIDRKVFNASRICKIYGTVAAKGEPTDERPHRLSEIISAPATAGIVSLELIEALQPIEEPKPTAASNDNPTPRPAPQPGTNNYALSALDDGLRKIASAGPGTRNDTLNNEAFGLAQLVFGGELNEQSTWTAIEQAALQCGLPANEIKSTMLSAFAGGRAKPRTAPEPKPRYSPPATRQYVDPETGEVFDTEPRSDGDSQPDDDEPTQPTRELRPEEAPLAGFVLILGQSHDGKIWLSDERTGKAKPHTAAQLLKRATLIELAPADAWDAAIRVAEPNQKFTPDNAVSLIVNIAKSLPEFKSNDNKKREPLTPAQAEQKAGFTILGYDRDDIFVFPFESKQLRSMSKSDMTETGLFSIAPMEFWLEAFPSKFGFDKSSAVNWLFRVAYERGVFNPDRIRGRGAWRDAGRNVLHLGDRMHVDGEYLNITELQSRYIYQAERPFPAFDDVKPLSDEEGKSLLELSQMFRWRVPASSALLAGWCLLAPLCGALNWRPHVWVTGGAGSGKSTIMERFVNPLMSAFAVYAQGNSSEAGLRQAIQGDAVPVLFEEGEQNDESEAKRMQAVLSLIRQSSSESGARTLKGTVSGKGMSFHVRSMFCLASIQVGIQHQADRERLTVLALREKIKKEDADEEEGQWQTMNGALYEIERDTDFAKRLLRRSTSMLPTIIAAVDVFVTVAAKHFGNQREGDQYGTLLAGAWCLTNTTAPTAEDALDWINSYSWNEYTEPANVNDADLALRAILDARVRTNHGIEATIFDVIDAAAFDLIVERKGESVPVLEYVKIREANGILQRNGMKITSSGGKHTLCLSNTSAALTNLVRHTKYAADLRGVLSRHESVNKDGGVVWLNGSTVRCMAIPLHKLV